MATRIKSSKSKQKSSCTKCYGKGYSSEFVQTHYAADFIGEKEKVENNVRTHYCDCPAGVAAKQAGKQATLL